jgi:hypothetical protein
MGTDEDIVQVGNTEARAGPDAEFFGEFDELRNSSTSASVHVVNLEYFEDHNLH